MQKVCVIGGGPTGITLGKEFTEAGIDYDLFEGESDFGGVWNGKEDCGRVYQSAHLISSKKITQLVDYPMPKHYPHYPSHSEVLEYWRDVARTFKVYDHTRFNSKVTELVKEKDGWKVVTQNGDIAYYELVYVCNGLQRKGRYPEKLDLSRFNGEVLHSIEYKGVHQIKDKRVLVIGGGNSGCDIVVDCVHTSEKVFHSTRRGYYYQPKFINGMPTPDWMISIGNKFKSKEESMAYMEQVFKLAGYDGSDYGLPKPDYLLDEAHPILNSQLLYHIGHGSIAPKGDVKSIVGNTVEFVDGSTEEVELIICATGYDRDFSFLEDGIVEFKDGIPDLFLHLVPKNVDNLVFVGFINSATGFGSFIKTSANFSKAYAKAFFNKSNSFKVFGKDKVEKQLDLGQGRFVESRRHRWEVDLWKYLEKLNHYTDVLSK